MAGSEAWPSRAGGQVLIFFLILITASKDLVDLGRLPVDRSLHHSAGDFTDLKPNILKFILCAFLSCFLTGFASGNDTLVSFHGSQIRLPREFRELSKKELNNIRLTFFNKDIMTVYERDQGIHGLEILIIYYDSLSFITELPFEKNVALKLKAIREDGSQFDNITIDKLHHCVFGKMVSVAGTSLFGFSVDRYGMMGFKYHNFTDIHLTDNKLFPNILKSVNHAAPYKYVPVENPKLQKAKKEMGESGRLMTIAFIVMIFIWAVRKYVIKKPEAKE